MLDRSGEIEVFTTLVHELLEKVRLLEFENNLRALSSTISNFNNGDTAWMLAATALVFLMTIPGTTSCHLFLSKLTFTDFLYPVLMLDRNIAHLLLQD